MLSNINIKNYVIIDSLELDFDVGLTALTGETGAGKSILLGALGLVLGDRAESDSISGAAEYAEIVADFHINELDFVIDWLKANSLDDEQSDSPECILRRRVNRDGRSRAFINGTPVNVSLLKELGEMLIDVHGQHEHQSLMKISNQRAMLDNYAALTEKTSQVSKLYEDLNSTRSKYDSLRNDKSDRENRLDLLTFQLNELESLALEKDEYHSLNDRHKKLAHAEKLLRSTELARQILFDRDEYSVQEELSKSLSLIEESDEFDDNLKPISTLLNDAQINIEEAISELNDYMSSLTIEPAELAEVESRLQTIIDLARKHHIDPKDLHEKHQQLKDELSSIDNEDQKLDELLELVNALEEKYASTAKELSDDRRKAAKSLEKKITDAMQTLGMNGGRFEISITSDADKPTTTGIDRIEFLVSANAGTSCKPLTKVASGGELARISLAIQMITASQSTRSTLIFDEVDSGVGGGIAEIIGKHLRLLGEKTQVMCITHLPQVASQAHQHLKVQKTSDKKTTKTTVDPLDRDQRIAEVARMLSGVDITKQSLAHAEEMITRASA